MKKIISFVMSIILFFVFPILEIEVSASISGTCGENVIWSFDSSDGTLTVSGKGDMMNFNNVTTWNQNFSKIVNIVIEDGVTSIGSNAFGECDSLINIFIPLSVCEININAFKFCPSLKNVYYEGNEENWKNITIYSGNECLIRSDINYDQTSIHECTFGEWVITDKATCVSDGYKIRKCSCGIEEKESIPATGIHNYEWKASIEVTCTENGEEKQQCIVCGKVGETRIINKLGHKKGEWQTETEATCTTSGSKVKKCETCGLILEKEIEKQLPHNFGEWKTTIKETEEHDGEETRTCKSCKFTEIRVIDNIKPSDEYVVGDANGDGSVTATDARLVLQVVAGLKENKDLHFTNADVNKDNMITAVDARMILQMVAGLI